MPNGAQNRGYQRGQQRGGGQRHGAGGGGPQVPEIDVTGISFKEKIDPELFNGVARRAAQAIAGPDRYQKNKPTQLRRFFDELVMWSAKVDQAPDRFAEYLPFIRMLNAKAAYADGRGLVDGNFIKLISHCLGQVTNPETLRYAKLFFEAFLGFYKEVRPKDS